MAPNRPLSRRAAAVLAALAAAFVAMPTASALPAPVLYWLTDAETGPAGDGILEPYDPALRNIPNATEPSTRPVFPGEQSNIVARFVAPANESQPTRIYGPLFAGIWLGRSAVLNGNVTAVVYELPAEGDAIELGRFSTSVDANLSNAPPPGSLVPPNPSDPQGSAFYIATQAAPLLLRPPQLFNFGFVDLNVSAGSRLAVAFHLDPGSSPVPVGIGVGTLEYDYALGYSYLFAPWYAPDPVVEPKPTPVKPTPVAPRPDPTTTVPADDDDDGEPSKDSPGLGLVALGTVALLGAALRGRRND